MSNSLTHITKSGETFDIIALNYYLDEFKSTVLRDANPQFAGVTSFKEGVKLIVPIIDEKTVNESLPPWKRV